MTENSDVGRRDQVWDAVLRTLAESPASIKYGDVETFLDAEVSERTIHRVMGAMRELGWLQKDRPRGHYWYPGSKARQYLNLYKPGDGRPDVDFDPTVPDEDPGDELDADAEPEVERVDDDRDDGDELPEFELDADVEARIDEAIEQLDPPGSGPIEEERRDVARRVLRHIVAEGEARPSKLQEVYFEAFPVGYGSARSWWKNFVYKALRDVDFVSTGGEGSPTWFYESDE